MTDPTVDGWTLPDDLYAAPIVVYPDLPTRLIMDLAKAKGLPDLADRLLVTAARLTQLAHAINPPTHAINPPTHDPDAAEWTFTWDGDQYPETATGTTLDNAEALAEWCDKTCPEDAPHRVVHVSELGR